MNRKLVKAAGCKEFFQFLDFLDSGVRESVTKHLLDAIETGGFPLVPLYFEGKRISPLIVSANALPQYLRVELLENLKTRIGESGAPSQIELDELQEPLTMHQHPIMKMYMFEGMNFFVQTESVACRGKAAAVVWLRIWLYKNITGRH